MSVAAAVKEMSNQEKDALRNLLGVELSRQYTCSAEVHEQLRDRKKHK